MKCSIRSYGRSIGFGVSGTFRQVKRCSVTLARTSHASTHGSCCFDFIFFGVQHQPFAKGSAALHAVMPCACAALHLTAAICILCKSFTSSPGQKIKRCSFVQHLPSLHAALVVLACGLTQTRTVALRDFSRAASFGLAVQARG